MQVKICGVKSLESAEVAVQSGADYIGFIFVKGSKREISPDKCLEISNELKNNFSKFKFKLVGLFNDQNLKEIEEIIDYSKLDIVQLCGEEDLDINFPSIRQIRIKSSHDSKIILDSVQKALLTHNHVVLDSFHEKKLGGTGNVFDWNIAKNVIGLTNVLVSGGLNPKNLKRLKGDFSPYGVDVSSGVETDGEKDSKKIKEFIKLAKEV